MSRRRSSIASAQPDWMRRETLRRRLNREHSEAKKRARAERDRREYIPRWLAHPGIEPVYEGDRISHWRPAEPVELPPSRVVIDPDKLFDIQ